ncbi:hypothetical protein [Bacillus pseudomycoides]|uniref:hypothetical protein n=1 Tax=Bacillus pseudomycoides TaxID=64104 RepID=UPI0020D28206|nr:hypothetical protein [Bacillus pseudomycoides]
MCACKETGVIRNDMGNGCYQFAPCICTAGNQSPEEVDERRHDVGNSLSNANEGEMGYGFGGYITSE